MVLRIILKIELLSLLPMGKYYPGDVAMGTPLSLGIRIPTCFAEPQGSFSRHKRLQKCFPVTYRYTKHSTLLTCQDVAAEKRIGEAPNERVPGYPRVPVT